MAFRCILEFFILSFELNSFSSESKIKSSRVRKNAGWVGERSHISEAIPEGVVERWEERMPA
jgi:hypothetical protein